MKLRRGCDELAAQLTELVQRATAVRRSLSRVEAEMGEIPEVAQSFDDLAALFGGTLKDVSERLGQLDEVLKELQLQTVA